MNQTTPFTDDLPPIPRTRIVPGQDYPPHLLSLYEYIKVYHDANGWSPSIRELRDAGYATSTSVIRYYLSKMQDFGMIEITPKISRGIRLFPRTQWAKHATQHPKFMIAKEIKHEAV